MSIIKDYFSSQRVALSHDDYYKIINLQESKSREGREVLYYRPDNMEIRCYISSKCFYLTSLKSYFLIKEITKEIDFKESKKKKIESLKFEKSILYQLQNIVDKNKYAKEKNLKIYASGNNYTLCGNGGRTVSFKIRKATTDKDLKLIKDNLEAIIKFSILTTQLPSLKVK